MTGSRTNRNMLRARPRQIPVSQGGFTLLELLLVVLLLSTATALAVPRIQTAYRSLAPQEAARKASAVVRRARIDAMRTQSVVAVDIDPTGAALIIQRHRTDRVDPLDFRETAVMTETLRRPDQTRRIPLPRDITLTMYPRILFYPDGTSTGGVARVQREGRGVGLEIVVEATTGRVAIVGDGQGVGE